MGSRWPWRAYGHDIPGRGGTGCRCKGGNRGADYIIVGHRIYEAKDPVAVVKEIVRELG